MAKIITFYSYKGGTGRSMALANVAWLLASNGKRVLLVDWDLEAPGLHRYLAPFIADKELTGYESQGVIDFFTDFTVKAATPVREGESLARNWYQPHANIPKWSKKLHWPSGEDIRLGLAGTGGIDFVPAGRQDADYAKRVNSFDWAGFYERFNGGAFIDAVRDSMSPYDYALIDSRTGVSDTSGICTVHLPEILVVCFTLNYQSITGAAAVAASVRAQRPDIRIFPVPTRVDPSEAKLLYAMKTHARSVFSTFLSPDLDADKYWFEMEIPYFARYAYAEKLAPFEEQTGITSSTLPAMERLTGYITAGDVKKLSPLPEPHRAEALAQFERAPEVAKPIGDRSAPSVLTRTFYAFARSMRAVAPLNVPLLASSMLLIVLTGYGTFTKLRPSEDPQRAALALLKDAGSWLDQKPPDKARAALLIAEASARTPAESSLVPKLRAALGRLSPLRIGHVNHGGPVRVVRFSPQGDLVATASDDGTAQLFKTAGGAPISWRAQNSGWAIGFSPDGRYLASGANALSSIYDRKTLTTTFTLPGSGKIRDVLFSPNSRVLLAADSIGVLVQGVEPWKKLTSVHDGGRWIWSVAYSPDSVYFAASTISPVAHVWTYQRPDKPVETLSPKPVEDHRKTAGSVRMIVFAPGASPRRLATASDDGFARIWTLTYDVPQETDLAHDDIVYVVAFSPDGTQLASGSLDGTARLWSVADGKLQHTLRHGGDVRSLAFTPNGGKLITGSGDGTARIWNTTTGREENRISFAKEVNSVAVSPDGTYLATGSSDGTAASWRLIDSAQMSSLSPEQIHHFACLQATRNLSPEEWRQYFGHELYRVTCSIY
jgi:WD40 repeat protein/MinD-like ATPase involved in chromosome partitioning or flagellar assembly